jgi:hypothetical protein
MKLHALKLRPKRYRPGEQALRETRRYQASTRGGVVRSIVSMLRPMDSMINKTTN